jgi:HAMP domain-containing protein
MATTLLFLIASRLVEVVAFGLLSGPVKYGGGNIIPQSQFALRDSRALAELLSLLPGKVSVFLQTMIEGNVLFFGMIALFGVVMAGLAIAKAAEFSRNPAEVQSLNRTLGIWKQKTTSLTRLLVEWSSRFPAKREKLTWKIAGPFAGMTFLVGLLTIAILYRSVASIIQDQARQRALTVATNLSDGAAKHISSRNGLALHALLAKYTMREEVAYAFVEDSKGTVLANSLGSFPAELHNVLAARESASAGWVVTRIKGQLMYDVRAPIADGQRGAAHVGIWKQSVDRQIRAVAYPVVGFIFLIFAVGAMFVFRVMTRLVRPILQLTENARQMSQGDLERGTGINSRDEIGDLARSLERMRSSLKAAMVRLNSDPATGE